MIVYVAGCDQGIGGDVWITNLLIESVSSWFSSEIKLELSGQHRQQPVGFFIFFDGSG
jgi:hypothetical protein